MSDYIMKACENCGYMGYQTRRLCTQCFQNIPKWHNLLKNPKKNYTTGEEYHSFCLTCLRRVARFDCLACYKRGEKSKLLPLEEAKEKAREYKEKFPNVYA